MVALILMIVAIVLFALAAFGVPTGSKYNLIAAGLAFQALALALPMLGAR